MDTLPATRSYEHVIKGGCLKKKRALSISQQLVIYQDIITGMFTKRRGSLTTDSAPSLRLPLMLSRRSSEANIGYYNRSSDDSCLMELKRQSPNSSKVNLKNTILNNDFIASDLNKLYVNTLDDHSSLNLSKDKYSHSSGTSCESLVITQENSDIQESDSLTENSLHNLALNHSDISLNMTHDSKIKESPSFLSNGKFNFSKDSVFDSSLDSSYLNKTFENGDIMNPRSPFVVDANLSRTQMICREMLITEKCYVNDLEEVIEGYIYHLKQQTDFDVEGIFGNLEAIYEFNKEVLRLMEECETDDNEINAEQLANVFCEKAEGFNHHYTCYCTNFPENSTFFSIIMQDPRISAFFLMRQQDIGHALSLESYLLKPVQRILKYHLLFRDMLKSYDGDEDGYNIISSASLKMSDVAEYINEMKRLHENAQKVQEILNKIIDLDEPCNVFSTGRLVLENNFKVHGTRSDRYFYLFEKLLLVCKKSDDTFHFKEKIECSDMMLQETTKDPLVFQVMSYSNPKVCYSIVAKNLEMKKTWIQHLKRLLVESHKAFIPQTVRQAILGPEEKSKSKYNSLSIDALDDPIFNTKITTKSANKESHGAGLKREHVVDRDLFSSKRNLNTKAKEFLSDKRNRVSLMPSSPNIHEKDKKEKNRWMRRPKQKRNADHGNPEPISHNSSLHDFNLKTEPLTKSRSLESLKDSMKIQDGQNDSKLIQENSHVVNDHDYAEISDIIRMIRQPIAGKSDKITENSSHLVETESSLSDHAHQEQILEELQPGSSCETVRQQNDFSQIRHRSNTTDKMKRLEKRLSILNDDDNSSTSIKAMVRKVSNAFGMSVQPFGESSLNGSTGAPGNVSRDLSILLGSSLDKSRYRNSIGGLQSPYFRPSLERSRSLTSFKEIAGKKDMHEEIQLNSVLPSKLSLSSNEEQYSSEDVDQVLESINFELGNIANSVDKGLKSSVSSLGTPDENNESSFPSTGGIGTDINARAAAVDERLREANLETASPNTAQELNVEVKRVADRIKEYKKLIDAEKKIKPLKRNEPLSMSEMIESLDSIRQSAVGSSLTYSYHRKRFSRPPSFLNQNDVIELEAENSVISTLPNDLLSQNENVTLFEPAAEENKIRKSSHLDLPPKNETAINLLKEKNSRDLVKSNTNQNFLRNSRLQPTDVFGKGNEKRASVQSSTVEEKRHSFTETRKAEAARETSNCNLKIHNPQKTSYPIRSTRTDALRRSFLIRTPSLPQMDKNPVKMKIVNVNIKSRRHSTSSASVFFNGGTNSHIRGRNQIRHSSPNKVSDNEVSEKATTFSVNRKSFYRSASLPRRSHRVELNAAEKNPVVKPDVTWSPSNHCNQQNLVNERIRQYFTNLQTASKTSTSRPRLLLVGSYDSDSDTSSDGPLPPVTSSSQGDNPSDGHEIVENDNPDHIMKGTVRNMIKKYATNYVFDK